MTGVLYTVAQQCLSLLPVDAAGRRCFDETLADWRKEAAQASGVLALVVPARAIWSVFRCLMLVSLREIRSREGASVLLRLAAWSIVCMLLFIGFHWNDSIDLEGTRVWMGPIPGVLLSVQIVTAMPFLAFLCAAVGRRHRAAVPQLGPALVVSAVMFVAMGWALPAANQAYREFVYALQSSVPILPGINERSLIELVGMLFTQDFQRAAFGLSIRLVFMVAVPAMLIAGAAARSLTGWRRAAGSMLPIPVLLLPALIGFNRYSEVAWWPALLAVILITRALASAERERAEVTS